MAKLSAQSKRPWRSSTGIWDKLDGYQKDAAEHCLKHKTVGLFYEQGVGKTWIAGGVVENLWHLRNRFQGLIIVPLSNLETTWHDFLSPHFQVVRSYKEYVTWNQTWDTRCILLLNYEAVNLIIEKLRKIKWDLIVYDEAHRLKDRSSLQSRNASKLRDSAVYKLILSGTPIERQPQDLWAQFRFLRPQIFGTRWSDFESDYLDPVEDYTKGLLPGTIGWKKALLRTAIEKSKRKFNTLMLPRFIKRIGTYALRLNAADVLKLPPLETVRCPVVLRGKQKRIYDGMERGLVATIDKQKIKAPLKVVQIAKLHQICGGWIIDEDGTAHEAGRAKLRETLRIIHREGKPIVVFARYLEELKQLSENIARGLSVDFIIGKNVKDRAEIVRRFQRGETDVLLAQIKTGGVGIDLFKACVGIMHSHSYSSIDFDQAVKRLHRRGQTRPVKIFLPYVVDSVDEDVYEAVVSKRKIGELVLDRLRKRRRT